MEVTSMALMKCPECMRQVSDQAVNCPNCGYPLAQSQAPDLQGILCGGRWLAQSGTLVDAQLEAIFSPDHTFQGLTRPDPNRVSGIQMVAYANFWGRWHVAGPQLFLDFPLTMMSGPHQTQIAMQFTRISDQAMSAVDKFGRPWEWQRVDQRLANSPGTSELKEHMRKQELLGTMLTNLANMRHEMLKSVAEKFGEEEANKSVKSKRARSTKKTPKG
jgi:hypothetical protein